MSCEAAVADYKAAWNLAQDLLKKNPDDQELQGELVAITDHLVDNALRAALHAANVLTLQSDYKGAMDWVNRILKFDPRTIDPARLQRPA